MTIVTCAIIENDGKVLCAQRSESMHLPLKWEFPGGKVEDGEDPEDCLKRELIEELGIEISIIERLPSTIHRYPGRISFELIPFLCRLVGGELYIREHRQVKWLEKSELSEMDWAEADIPILGHFLNNY